MNNLEGMLLNRYIQIKTINLNIILKRNSTFSTWMTDDVITDVEPFVLHILLYFVFIQEELLRFLPSQKCDSIVSLLVGNFFQSFMDFLDLIPQFSESGLQKVFFCQFEELMFISFL